MKTEKFDYLLFSGPAKDELSPICAYKDKKEAIEAARRLEGAKVRGLKCIEVVYMPEDNDDINEVIWTNC